MNRPALRTRLSAEEARRRKAYLDSLGILSIGVGHNCIDQPVPGVTKVGDEISEAKIDELLDRDLDEAANDLDTHLPWWRQLDDDRQNVMLDLCFNMGITVLLGFHHFLTNMQAGIQDPIYYGTAADDLFHSHWHAQVGKRAAFLEGAVRTGQYT